MVRAWQVGSTYTEQRAERELCGGYERNCFYLPVVVASSVDLSKSKRVVAPEILTT
jgi:hypothetical protein